MCAQSFLWSLMSCAAESIYHLSLINQPITHSQGVWISPAVKAFFFLKREKNEEWRVFFIIIITKTSTLWTWKGNRWRENRICSRDGLVCHRVIKGIILTVYSKDAILHCVLFAVNLCTGIKTLANKNIYFISSATYNQCWWSHQSCICVLFL